MNSYNDIVNVADDNHPIGSQLSLFKNTPFVFGNITFHSVESFLQAMKFDTTEKQKDVASLEAYKARMKGKKLTKKLIEEPFVYWNDQKIAIHSEEYYKLIYEGLKAKFTQNLEQRTALFLTENNGIIFDNGFEEPKFNMFPNKLFLDMLNNLRAELQAEKRYTYPVRI